MNIKGRLCVGNVLMYVSIIMLKLGIILEMFEAVCIVPEQYYTDDHFHQFTSVADKNIAHLQTLQFILEHMQLRNIYHHTAAL